MSKVSAAGVEFREMDELAAQESAIHALHPLIKLLVTLAYIIVVVSFPKYALSGLSVMVLYPILIFQASGIPVRTCFHKLRVVMPLVCAVGLLNPFFDRVPLRYLGNLAVSGGVISMITLMLKGIFSLMASFLLVATTKMDALCAEEISIMTDAYHLRAPGQKGIHISAWGSFLGQLLLRSMDRADELYQSMQLRGFCGDFYYADSAPCTLGAAMYGVLWVGAFLLARCFDLPLLLGNLFL